MRVALVSTHTLPSAQPGSGDAGGMNVYILELAKRLRSRGHHVELATRPRDLAGFDVVHTHYWRSALLAMDQDIPFVHSMHTMGLVKDAERGADQLSEPAARIEAERAVARAAARLVANTATEADHLVRLYGAERARIAVVHPGVDTDVFAPRPELRESDLVVFAGRIQPLKAPDLVLRAAALVDRPVRVAVIGGSSGPEAMQLPELAESLGVRAAFVPPVPHADLARWLAKATVVCVPSRSESFGLVALEALACGTPVIATRVGGLSTVVVDGVTGLLVDGHDARRWADAITRLLGDAAQRESMGAKAVAHASGFSWEAMVDATEAVYKSVARQPR